MDKIPIPPGLAAEAERALASPTPARNLATLVAGAATRIPIAELTETAMALRAANPTDRLIWVLTDPLFYTQVPSWHWRMVADRARNRAYERAIRASLTPGMTVLEIGTGAGLLAMMAARAGAGHVFTIEENPLMAETARRTIAANGLAERITVIEASSQAVEVGRELPRPLRGPRRPGSRGSGARRGGGGPGLLQRPGRMPRSR
ncbi:MAG: 50S ribosomal protein L11 methyltransferase [Pseudomonadota bacterium]